MLNGEPLILQDRAHALAAYPHARVVQGFIYVSGISSRRPDGSYEGVDERDDGTFTMDIELQARAVIENLKVILERAGANLAHCVDLTVFLVNMQQYQAFNRVYNQYFEAATGPARTCVAVKELPSPKLLVEIKVVAVHPSSASGS